MTFSCVRPPASQDAAANDPLPDVGAYARKLLGQRRRRDQIFGVDLFGEPVWDMLLDLFASTSEGREVSISSLCIASGVPTTSALRHIAMLVERGLLLRRRDFRDGRRVLMELSPALQERLGLLLLGWMEDGSE
ncbi:MarR family transcriptional regulator [Sphingobium sp.]|uniref:MarR family transcriptional regulator n=1 Tax=Sphingobium sp. TaxID=1912891 RepID=UPI0028BF38BF|nr:MarR family transcriptional regulator [Sphingobium sp.]